MLITHGSNFSSHLLSTMATEAISAHESDVFLYRGAGGPPVPAGTRRIRVHPSVTAIPEGAFQCNDELELIELPLGLESLQFYDFASTKGSTQNLHSLKRQCEVKTWGDARTKQSGARHRRCVEVRRWNSYHPPHHGIE